MFQLLAHFKFFQPMKVFLNTVVRIVPGVTVYLVFTVIIMASWAQGYFLLFSPYVAEFKTYYESLLAISYLQFYDLPDFK